MKQAITLYKRKVKKDLILNIKSDATILNVVENSLVPLFDKALTKIYFIYDTLMLHQIKVSIEIGSDAVLEASKSEYTTTFKAFIFSSNRDFLSSELSKIHIKNKDFESYYRFYLSGIQGSKKALLDTEVGYSVVFKQHNYSIFLDDKREFKKTYMEQLSTKEIAEVINHITKSALEKTQR